MLRFLYTVCDLVAGICAIVSPVAIIHWLAKIINQPGLESIVTTLNPVFEPLNAILELFIKAPPLAWEGHSYSTTQGLLACILTFGFFLCNFLSETLKAYEQRLDVNRQNSQQRHRLAKIESEQKKQQKQISANRRVFLQVICNFIDAPQAGSVAESGYLKFNGKAQEVFPTGISVEFDSLDHAFKYGLELSQAILSLYASMRPVDPQPPFQIGIQTLDVGLPTMDGVQRARFLANFAGPNQIVFSQDAKALLEAQGLHMRYQFQSLGMYAVAGRQEEIFRLFYEKRERSH